MAEAMRVAWEKRRKDAAVWSKRTMGPTTGTNRTALSRRARSLKEGVRGGMEEEMADVEEGGVTSATTLVSVRNTRVFRTALTALMEPRTL